ncbi:MAG TPA: OB-fold nucleic acid binding domain-containing protein [Actinomycetota bacterium]|nr:OB-fold nucleic acid binding domain-containing protein [Actinomycetota bacterium]
MGIFERFFRRLAVDAESIRVAEVGRWAQEIPGVVSIGEAEPRAEVKVAGVVERLRVRPQKGVPAIEAVLVDGTGMCTAVWLGRRSIKGLELGRRMVIEGRLAVKDGDRQIMNPTFEFADQRVIEERMKRKKD